MKIAVLADVHGNRVALDAVLTDAEAAGAEAYWFIGDYVAIGPEPARVLERITQLPNARFLRGNTDRYVATGEAPQALLDAARTEPDSVEVYGRAMASFGWTRGRLQAEWLDWLAALELDLDYRAADGVRIHAVHAAPGTDDGDGIHPGLANAEIDERLRDTEADMIIVAHTHEAMVRRVGMRVVVNTGSVSNPRAPDLRAAWLLIDSSTAGTTFTMRRTGYDHTAFAETVRHSRHPATDMILALQRGEQAGQPPHPDHTPHLEGRSVLVSLDAC